MDEYYPSEIARLVLGYLKEVRCLNSWQTFLIESADLQEYYRLCKEGKQYPTNVNGKSLLEILREYCFLRRGSSKQSGVQYYSNSTSDPFNFKNCETDKKDFFNYQSMAQKSFDDINKVKSNEDEAGSLDDSNSLICHLQVANDYENIIKRFLARAEADPVFDKYLSYICTNYKKNLIQESFSSSVKSSCKSNDVREGNRGSEISASDKKVENTTMMNSFTNKNTGTILEVNSVLKSNLKENDTFSNHDTRIHNSDALTDDKNVSDISQNLANSVVNSVDNNNGDEDSVVELPVYSIQKQKISKYINVPAEVSSAPCMLIDKVNAQTIDPKSLSVDIQDSCNGMLNEHKPKSTDSQSHSRESLTNIADANAVGNESLQVLQNCSSDCHSQPSEKSTKENNSSFQMCFTSNEQSINTEERTRTIMSSDVSDVQKNCIGESKFTTDDISDKTETENINHVFSNSDAPIVTENIVSGPANICDKAIYNNFTIAGSQPNTLIDINPLISSVQSLNAGTSIQTVNNLLPTSPILQWPYSAVPTIFPDAVSNAFSVQNGYQYNLVLNTGLDLNSSSTGKIIFINKIPPKDTSLSTAVKSCTNGSENGIIKNLNSRSPSTKTPENNKRKKDIKNESQCPAKRTSVDNKSPLLIKQPFSDNKSLQKVKQLKTYSNAQKLNSVFPSGACATPKTKHKNGNEIKKSGRTNTNQKSVSFSNKKLSKNKTDIKSGRKLFSEDTETQSPVLESLISSAKLLSSERGCSSAAQAQSFPNRRTSLRLKKLQSVSTESQNLDTVADNNTTFMKDVSQKEKTAENMKYNDNSSDSNQRITNDTVTKTIKDAYANKPVISELGNEVFNAMNKVMQLKLSNCMDKILPDASETSCFTDISTEIQSDVLNDSSSSSNLPDISESYNFKSGQKKAENELHITKKCISSSSSICPEQVNNNHVIETGELNLKITDIFSGSSVSKNVLMDEESTRCSNKESQLAQAIAFITSEDFLADKSKFIRNSGKDLIVDSNIKITVQESSSELSSQKTVADAVPDFKKNVKAEKSPEEQAKTDIKEEPEIDEEKGTLNYLMEKMQEYGIEKMMSILKEET